MPVRIRIRPSYAISANVILKAFSPSLFFSLAWSEGRLGSRCIAKKMHNPRISISIGFTPMLYLKVVAVNHTQTGKPGRIAAY